MTSTKKDNLETNKSLIEKWKAKELEIEKVLTSMYAGCKLGLVDRIISDIKKVLENRVDSVPVELYTSTFDMESWNKCVQQIRKEIGVK